MSTDKENTQPLALVVDMVRRQRFARLKHIADLTGKRLLFVYLEDERKRKCKNETYR